MYLPEGLAHPLVLKKRPLRGFKGLFQMQFFKEFCLADLDE